MTPLDSLRAAARGAIDDGNPDLVRALLPVIEAEEKRLAEEARKTSAAAPVSLALVRAKKEAGK